MSPNYNELAHLGQACRGCAPIMCRLVRARFHRPCRQQRGTDAMSRLKTARRKALQLAVAVIVSVLTDGAADAADAVRLLTARPGWKAGMAWDAKDRGLWQKHNLDVQHTSLDT